MKGRGKPPLAAVGLEGVEKAKEGWEKVDGDSRRT